MREQAQPALVQRLDQGGGVTGHRPARPARRLRNLEHRQAGGERVEDEPVDLRRIVRDGPDREPLPQTQQLFEHLAVVDRAARRRVPRTRVDEVPVGVDADERHRVAGDGAVEREHAHPTRVGGGWDVRRSRRRRRRRRSGTTPRRTCTGPATRAQSGAGSAPAPAQPPSRARASPRASAGAARAMSSNCPEAACCSSSKNGPDCVQRRRDHEQQPERPELREWWRQRVEHRRQ